MPLGIAIECQMCQSTSMEYMFQKYKLFQEEKIIYILYIYIHFFFTISFYQLIFLGKFFLTFFLHRRRYFA